NTIRVERRLQISLFILRLTISWFLMQWAVEKFVKPDVTSKIFAFFYKVPLDVNLSPVIGGVQMIIVIAFLVGFMKPLSYGVVALMHSVSTAATWKSLIMPFAEGSNHLFTTAVPVLAACWILFALRDQDVMLSVDSWRAGRRGTNSLSDA
ncbi:MAG: hypothetical protein AB7V39_20095, partial [Nitrospiraceae bacterium]